MSKEQKQIVEEIRKREQDIEIMQLLLKHRLTKKRAEYKLLIMYYKACNMVSKAKLMMIGTDDKGIRIPPSPQTHKGIKQTCLWDKHFKKQASNL